MVLRVGQLAAALGAEVFGDQSILIHKLSEPGLASERDLALAMSPRYEAALKLSAARAAVVWTGADWEGMGLEAAIVVPRPRLAMAGLTDAFAMKRTFEGIHPTAILHPDAEIDVGVHIGPFAVVGSEASIKEGCWVGAHVSIAGGSRIGAQSILSDGVRVGAKVMIGQRAILQSNAVVGGDGFSFVTSEPSNEEIAFKTAGRRPLTAEGDATRHRIHSLGGVLIADDVEIGANSTIDAGTIRATQVGRGTKIDNLVQVGHNVIVGEDCVLCAQAAVAGSARLGDRVVMGGKSGIKDNVIIGSDVVLAGGAIVLSSVSEGQFMMGYPAVDMQAFRAQQKALKRLQHDRDGHTSTSS